ncbi:MAG: hypothetical protein Q7R73_03210 [bacterium]|nr:hypothetical protein [bacterium]
MREIHIKTISHNEQRYPTTGDYWRDTNGVEQVRVSDVGNPDYEFLVALHELVEWYLTEKRGIKEEDVSAFDIQFEKEIEEGKHPEHAEPGFDPRAPYIKEHTFAIKIEKEIAEELGIDWEKYSERLQELYGEKG